MREAIAALVLFLTIPLPSFAFDKIKCESQLHGWSVWNGFGKKNKILYDALTAISLPEKYSQALIVKNQNGNSVVEIYPWDGIDLIVVDKSQKYHLATDNLARFEITFAGKPVKKLSCELSF